MAQKVKVTVRKRVRKTGGDSGYVKCPDCNGTWRKKKKKTR